MFDLGFGLGEVIVLVLVSLIVIGPHDLPNFFFKIGKFIGNIRNMATDFKNTMDDMAHEQEINQIKKHLEEQKLTLQNSAQEISNLDKKS
jgi:sec-independent protein translocase protein TatB